MPSLTRVQTLHLLLLTYPFIALAQQQPLHLNENGEAVFNIPVVVKMASSGSFAAAAAAAHHRRDTEADALPAAAGESEAGQIHLAPPAYIDAEFDPEFEINHQGQDEDEDEHEDELRKRAVIPDQAIATHTILLVETTGTATSTLSDALHNTTSSEGRLPPAMNHTSFPLTNSTNNGTLNCNGTGVVAIKPGGKANATGAPMPANPANVGGKPSTTGAPIKSSAIRVVGSSVFAAVVLGGLAAMLC